MQVWQGYVMASVIIDECLWPIYYFFHRFDNLAVVLNILAYFSQTQPEMHVYLNFMFAHIIGDKKTDVINVHSSWHIAPSEAGYMYIHPQIKFKVPQRITKLICKDCFRSKYTFIIDEEFMKKFLYFTVNDRGAKNIQLPG